MSTSPSSPRSYIRQNLPPLIVGLAAIVAIVGGLFVVIDRIRDDDDGDTLVFAATARGSDEAPEGLRELLEALGGGGPLLGVSVTEYSDVLIVDVVLPGSPADDAGLEVGDEIREVNGDRVRSVDQLRTAIASVEVGEEYEIEVRRDGDPRTLTARRAAFPDDAVAALLQGFLQRGFDLDDFDFGDFEDLEQFDFDRFDLEGFDLEPFRDRRGFRVDPDPFSEFRLQPTLGISVVQTNEGLMVVGVERGSVADRAGLEAGDIIVQVDGRTVRTIEALRSALPTRGLDDGGRSSIVDVVRLVVSRGGRAIEFDAVFPVQPPIQIFPQAPRPELPLASPTPDLFAERLLDELAELESYLDSDEFLDQLGERLRADLEALVADAFAAAAENAAEPDADAEGPGAALEADLEVFRGTVATLTDDQITLGGSLGSISFDLTDRTAIVGGAPSVGRVSTVAANGDREAILVLTPN